MVDSQEQTRSDPNAQGLARWAGSMARVFTGGRRDLNYYGWLYFSCFGRAKFTEGTMVAFEPEPKWPIESEDPDEAGKASEEMGDFRSDPNREFRTFIRSPFVGKRFRMSELPGLNELEDFVNEISPAVRSKLAWQINKTLGLDTNAIRQLLKDKSVAEEWLRFEQESK